MQKLCSLNARLNALRRAVSETKWQNGEKRKYNIWEYIAVILTYVLVVVFFPISLFVCMTIVPEYTRAVVLRLGRLRRRGLMGPGVCFYLPCIDEAIRVDLRTTSLDVPPQEILTKDSVTIKVDGVIYFRIKDPIKAVLQVVNVREATEYLAQTTLRKVSGTKMLIELLTSREQLSNEILHVLDDATDIWGVKVERVEIKDIKLPHSMQRALAQEAQALREAKAKIAAAEGEKAASKALKAASDIMNESPLTLQLRYMETLNVMTQGKKSDISLPTDMQRSMAAEQEALRQAKAKVVAADGELQSSAMLREASETMVQNPIALQLRYLQTLTNISNEENHTIVVPLPLDIIGRVFGGGENKNAKPDKFVSMPSFFPTSFERNTQSSEDVLKTMDGVSKISDRKSED